MGLHFRKEGRGCSQKEARLGLLVLAGLGMMIFLLSGCGSDNTPKRAASAKEEKAAKSGSTMQTKEPLFTPKKGGIAPPLGRYDNVPGMPFQGKELEEKRAAAERAYEKLDPKQLVFPGITKEQLEAKLKAERGKKPDPDRAIFPGLSPKQLDAKLNEQRKRGLEQVPIFPGLTEAQMRINAAQARQTQETKSSRIDNVFPPK